MRRRLKSAGLWLLVLALAAGSMALPWMVCREMCIRDRSKDTRLLPSRKAWFFASPKNSVEQISMGSEYLVLPAKDMICLERADESSSSLLRPTSILSFGVPPESSVK